MAEIVSVYTRFPALIKELAKVLPQVKFHEVTNPEQDPQFTQSHILVCDYDKLAKQIKTLPNTKWVQGTWAGVDALTPSIDPSQPPPFKITRFSGDHFGKLMSEYVIANIVNTERDFFKVYDNNKKAEWNQKGIIKTHRAIYDLTIGILGVGNIGNRIGKILDMMGARVLGLGRKPSIPKDGGHSHIREYYTTENLPELLKQCDYLVNVLPKTPETTGLLDGDVLQNCKKEGTIFINIGRSNVISDDALIKALEQKWLSRAILDVFHKEPLPVDNPLWRMPQVFITPHVAGFSRPQDVAQQFRTNYKLYLENAPLPAQIDFKAGY